MPKPKDEDRVLLKTLVDELDRASSEEDKKACSSTLSKYLNAAPKFIKSGVTQIGDRVETTNKISSESLKSVYKPQFVYEDVSLAKEEEKKNKQETDELLSDKKRKANIDEFLDELSNQTTPKKTKRNSDTTGYLKITNLSIGISEPNLKKEFSKFGRINNCYIEPSSGADSVTCFLEFRKTYDAECAMHALQKKKICGQSQNIQIQWCSNEEIDDLQKRFQKHFDENTKSDFVKMVSDLDTRRNTIMNVMGFCLDYQNNAEDIIELFMKNIFSTVAKKSSSFSKKLACLYVFNDILFNQKYGPKYQNFLQDRMLGILQSTLDSSTDKEQREKVVKILELWKEKKFFSISKIQGWMDII